METRKEVLSQLKKTEPYFQNENLIAVKCIVDNCITLLERSIKEDNDRADRYINDLLKELK